MVPFCGENVFPINLGVSLVSTYDRWSGLSMIIQIKHAFNYTIFGIILWTMLEMDDRIRSVEKRGTGCVCVCVCVWCGGGGGGGEEG